MRSLYHIINFIIQHPLAGRHRLKYLKRFIAYQISKIFNPYPIVYTFTNRTRLIIEAGMTGATGNIYCGLHEFEDMGFLLHLLRPEDLFVDVGANVGSYTVLASGHIGCYTKAFEPVPATFLRLKNNIAINFLDSRVDSFNVAIGSEKGQIRMTTSLDTVNHVQFESGGEQTIMVPVEKLDDMVTDKIPVLLKIDVEGFETEVIKGAESILHHPEVVAIIIELNGSGSRYGFDEASIHQKLLASDFRPHKYDPFTRQLKGFTSFGTHNTIYIRNLDFVTQRVSHAEAFSVNGILI